MVGYKNCSRQSILRTARGLEIGNASVWGKRIACESDVRGSS